MVRMAYDPKSKTEIANDEGYEVLHLYGFPADIVPAVNKYNREHPGPDGNAINITQICIDALRSELKKREVPDVQDHPLLSQTHNPNVGPVELRRAADLIRGMGSKPDNEPGLKGRECQCIVVDEGVGTGDAESDDGAQTGEVIGYTDRTIWLCPRCVTVITNLEYVHLNRDGYCDDCGATLEQYEKIEWRP